MKKEDNYFRRHYETYAEEILSIQPEFYKNSAAFINEGLNECSSVLDIGNGGVINYNYEHLSKLDCVDIVLNPNAIEKYSKDKQISFFKSNILDLQEIKDGTYDAVVIQAVIHHLAGLSKSKTDENVKKALSSCSRVLKPNGKILIIESVVVRPFEILELVVYPLMQLFFKICKFDTVFQFSDKSLCKFVELLGYKITNCAPVNLDKFVWLMGRKVPTVLTPCRAIWIEIEKR